MIFESPGPDETLPVSVKVFEIRQPIGLFYVGVLPANDLKLISYADTRRQSEKENDSYTGIQRELSLKRKAEIKQYVNSFDASFPNSFIISVDPKHVVSEQDGVLLLKRNEDTASIIDGQHRLSGFPLLSEEPFDLIVAIFIDLPIEDQAMLFATINIKQTRVNPSLVYDLYEETKSRSPQKTCHNISKSLNTDKSSPFYHQIKPLGKRTEEYTGKLTQATFVKKLLPLICVNEDNIREQIKRGNKLSVDDPTQSDRVFWRFFAEDKDWAILRVVNNYFSAVDLVFEEDWRLKESPLGRTIGFSALMRLLGRIAHIGLASKPEPRLDQEFFQSHLVKALSLRPFTFETYPASGVGESKLFKALEAAVFQ